MKNWTLAALFAVLAAACGGTKKGTVPVDHPIYTAPANDPSAEEPEAEEPPAEEGAEPSSRAPGKPAPTPASTR